MGKIIKNIAVAATTMFIVGALLALAAPVLADIAGVAVGGHTVDPLWTGLFFGAFGGIHAAVQPAMDKMFRRNPPQVSERVIVEEKTVTPQIAQDVQPEQAATKGSYCHYVEKERTTTASEPQRTF